MVFYFGFGIQNYGEKFETMANSTITIATIGNVILHLNFYSKKKVINMFLRS